ncbi:epoxide hydrolase 4-like isoform X2 [Acropora palmata]|uniref:epoxide hydrolase 4-like isoform X2 n=1 Tax=Acropora palmata TaxID=6131 RepID=UPI003DA09479
MMAKVTEVVFVYSLSLFYGILVCFSVLWQMIKTFRIPSRPTKRETPPSCLLDPELGEHDYLRTASNLKIHYVAKGDTGKPLMLCLHGFPEFWYSWRYQLKAFSDDFRVVAVDLRGYGDSDHPTGRSQYKMSYLVNDVKEIIEALGYSSCTLLCHDWGGCLGWTLAHFHPELVDKLIACNIPHPRCFKKCLQSSRKQYYASWYIFFFQLPFLPEHLVEMDDFKMLGLAFKHVNNFTDEDLEAYKYALGHSGLSGPINYYRNIFGGNDMPRNFSQAKIKVPTLIVWGKKDQALTVDTLVGTEQYVEDLTIKYVDEANHWVQMDAPEAVNRHIREFLAAHP